VGLTAGGLDGLDPGKTRLLLVPAVTLAPAEAAGVLPAVGTVELSLPAALAAMANPFSAALVAFAGTLVAALVSTLAETAAVPDAAGVPLAAGTEEAGSEEAGLAGTTPPAETEAAVDAPARCEDLAWSACAKTSTKQRATTILEDLIYFIL